MINNVYLKSFKKAKVRPDSRQAHSLLGTLQCVFHTWGKLWGQNLLVFKETVAGPAEWPGRVEAVEVRLKVYSE